MKKIRIKYQILLSGFPGIKGEYKFHEFKLKEQEINPHYLVGTIKSKIFNTSLYLGFCMLSEDNKGYINYFENDDFFEFDIANNCILDKNKIDKLIKKYPIILNRIKDYLTELRLTLNIPVSMPSIKIEIYDFEEHYIGSFIHIGESPFWNRLSYINPEELSNNTRFHLELKYFKDIKNDRYKRALLFFNESFESGKKEIRFINLISTLESLFNYKLTNEESITKKVSHICATIFSTFNDKYDEYYEFIKKMYDKRSRYLHGNNNTITIDDEKNLRKITRIVLIIYSIVALEKKYTPSEMIKYLSDTKSMDIGHQLFLKTLFASSFKEQQLEILELLKEKKIAVPKEFEEKIKETI